MDNYLKGVPDVSTEHRARMFRFIESISASPVVCALHYGGGTLEVQKVAISGATAFDEYKKWAEMLAGIIPKESGKGERRSKGEWPPPHFER